MNVSCLRSIMVVGMSWSWGLKLIAGEPQMLASMCRDSLKRIIIHPVFQHGNNRKPFSKTTTALLKKLGGKCHELSSDLKPIEPLWRILFIKSGESQGL